MRKGIFVVFLLVAIVAIVTVPAGAKDEKVTTSQGQPFLEIWTAIKDLQNKLDKIQLTPGPVGPQGIQGPKGDTGSCSCEVSLKEFNLLKERVAALEGGCHPVSETCNGIDDNCDGLIDNGAPCGTGQECVGGQCTSGCQPVSEVCNGKDDDCDGVIDDGDLCGIGEQCISGWCMGGCQPVSEVCNGKDDDCDGIVDEDLGTKTCGIGECARTVETCIGGVMNKCIPGSPAVDVCNGKDDDCDGVIDYLAWCPVGQQCISGKCMSICQPAPEVCNGKDDDCDGSVDEQLVRSCYTGPAGTRGVGICASGSQMCSAGIWGACSGEVLPAAETCDGVDNDCDGVIDDGDLCGIGEQCSSGQCIGTLCQLDADCPVPMICGGGMCR